MIDLAGEARTIRATHQDIQDFCVCNCNTLDFTLRFRRCPELRARWILMPCRPADEPMGTPAVYSTGDQPYHVAVADLNHDGVPDLVTSNYGDGTLSVLRGIGDGTFCAQETFSVPGGGGPVGITVADFNGDGNDDLAVTAIVPSLVDIYLAQ